MDIYTRVEAGGQCWLYDRGLTEEEVRNLVGDAEAVVTRIPKDSEEGRAITECLEAHGVRRDE